VGALFSLDNRVGAWIDIPASERYRE